jgi:hypothetical protein
MGEGDRGPPGSTDALRGYAFPVHGQDHFNAGIISLRRVIQTEIILSTL